jgi:hypothetical protein
MKRASEHYKGVNDVAEFTGDINDGIGGHLDHVRRKNKLKIGLD